MRSALSARRTKMAEPLTEQLLRKTMRSLFPKRSDYGSIGFDELNSELQKFGITSHGRFSRLMKRHRRQLIEIDRDRITFNEVKWYSESFGETFVKDAIRRQYWFAFPALVRTALELEFGKDAVVYESEA